jgi:hypothetical protein
MAFRVVVGLLLLALAGCVSNQPPVTTQAAVAPAPTARVSPEVAKAQAQAWVGCAIAKSLELDDRKSDAGTVVVAVKSACHPLYKAAPAEETGFTSQIVLKVRAQNAQFVQMKQQADANARIWANCAVPKIRELDDGHSDPSSIATAVMTSCHQYYRGNPSQERQVATQVVMLVRGAGGGAARQGTPPPQGAPQQGAPAGEPVIVDQKKEEPAEKRL